MKIPSYLFGKKYSGIYCIENSFNKKRYIGSSKDVYSRLHKHNSLLNNNKHENKYLQNSWNKNGNDKFECYIIEFCKESDLTLNEQLWIDELNPEYNLTIKVERNILSKESRQQISKTLKEGYKTGRIQPTKTRSVKVYNLDGQFIKEFKKIKNACIEMKLCKSSVERCLAKTYQQHKGYQFRYTEDNSEVLPIRRSKYLNTSPTKKLGEFMETPEEDNHELSLGRDSFESAETRK